MKFYELVTQVLALLQREGRVSYRALKIEFDLTDDHLEALKEDLIDAKRLAVDENGKVLVWAGGATVAGSQLSVASCQLSKVWQHRSVCMRFLAQDRYGRGYRSPHDGD